MDTESVISFIPISRLVPQELSEEAVDLLQRDASGLLPTCYGKLITNEYFIEISAIPSGLLSKNRVKME